MADVDSRDVEVALDVARAAGAITLRHFRSRSLEVSRKSDGTEVTASDLAAETEARNLLEQARPGDSVLGEEYGATTRTGARTWLIDPIDGTRAFVRGVPLYSTLVALVDEKGPSIGVIHMPALDTTLWAARGGGCFADGEMVCVSGQRTLAGAFLTTSGFNNWRPDAVGRVLGEPGLVSRTWGDGYGYALVATGRADAMVDFGANPWDVAAPKVIVEEAGGRFTDLTGIASIDGHNGVATNGHLHGRLLTLLAGPEQADAELGAQKES